MERHTESKRVDPGRETRSFQKPLSSGFPGRGGFTWSGCFQKLGGLLCEYPDNQVPTI